MAELTLREYEERIRAFLDNEQFEEAIAWAQHLLRKFPKYIRGYEYLAQAAMETGREDEALEIFRRVLSTDPESVVAYTGAALIFRRMNVLHEAIWHMMRAFELQPGTPFIREQLRDMYAEYEGRRPGRLKLNRAALGRAHLRNGQYDMAIRELRAELAEDPNRIDLRVALAEALWRAGRYREAVDEAELVLQELPRSLKANLILGQFYTQEGDTDRAAEYLQVAQRLDPENRVARELFGNRSPLPVREITLSEPSAEPAPPEPEPLETSELSWSLEETALFAETTETPPLDWRETLRQATEEALTQVPTSSVSPPPTVDWRDALRQATEEALASLPVSEAPAWVAALRDATEEALSLPAAVEAPAAAPAPASEASSWVAELREATAQELEEAVEAEAAEPTAHSPEAPVEAPPAWVAELRGAIEEAVTEAIEILPTLPEEEIRPEIPPWVGRLYEATAAALTEIPEEAERPPVAQAEAAEIETPSGEAGAVAEALEDVGAEPSAEAVAETEFSGGEAETIADVSGEAQPQAAEEEAVTEALEEPEPLGEASPEVVDEVPGEIAVVPEVEQVVPEAETPPPSGEPVEVTIPEMEQARAVTDVEAPTPEAAEPVEVSEAQPEADELAQARALARAGNEAEALAIFTALFEAGGRDEDLAEALAEWVATGTTGPQPHQLLGDVYHRLGRLREAVEQYRQALQKL